MAHPTDILDYQVTGTLGFGARSTIYAVRDGNGQAYALKRVLRQQANDYRYLEQAMREHHVASQVNHPNLRRSYRMHRHRSLLRLTEVLVLMELVEGDTLEHVPIHDVPLLCRAFQEVAHGLAALHRRGWVHADIKPSNLLLTPNGQLKIIDFGQSCAAGTVKQRIQGTPDYIAPEQVLRRAISPATDVFNLGATMYWVLTGKHVPTLMVSDRTQPPVENPPPPAGELNPAVPKALSSLILSCVRTDPRHRPFDMTEVVTRLELALRQLDGDEPRGPGPVRDLED